MSVQHLNQQEGIEKIKSIVNKIDICMMCTFQQEDGGLLTVPMSRQEVDEEGNIWFLFSADSGTFRNLKQDGRIHLSYSDPASYTFVSVYGLTEISESQEKIDKYWNKMMEAWFEKGKDDPRIRILQVVTQGAHYWDNPTNKLVTFAKMATSAITGEKMDIGREGNIDL